MLKMYIIKEFRINFTELILIFENMYMNSVQLVRSKSCLITTISKMMLFKLYTILCYGGPG